MDERQKQRAAAESSHQPPRSGQWTLSRIQMTSSLWPKEWPVARIELFREDLGSVLEIATGAGCLDAACNAIAQLFGVTAPIRSLDVKYQVPRELSDGVPVVVAVVDVAVDGTIFRGSAISGDLFVSAVGAYLDGICRALGPEFSSRAEWQ